MKEAFISSSHNLICIPFLKILKPNRGNYGVNIKPIQSCEHLVFSCNIVVFRIQMEVLIWKESINFVVDERNIWEYAIQENE